MRLPGRNNSPLLMACVACVALSSCVTLPKMSTLAPLPEYPADVGGWQTSATCVIVAKEPDVPVEDIARRMESEGYNVCLVPPGYLTRAKRLATDRAFVVETYYAVNLSFSDGSCIDSLIAVTIHDTANLQMSGPFVAQARSITQPVDLRSIPGGKELLKEIKNNPESVAKVPEFLGKDPQTTTATVNNGKIFVTEGNVFENLMSNLLCQPEVRQALAPTP